VEETKQYADDGRSSQTKNHKSSYFIFIGNHAREEFSYSIAYGDSRTSILYSSLERPRYEMRKLPVNAKFFLVK
jgi:hypothetical protein